jgi:hypothetical protein
MNWKVFVFFSLFISLNITIDAQTATDSLHHANADTLDIIDLLHKIVSGKNRIQKTTEEARGKVHASLVPAVGVTLQTGFVINLTGNLAFYTSKEKKQNLSSIFATVAYTGKGQLLVPIISNIWTRNNKYNFIGNWHFLKYNEVTYGLGGNTNNNTANQLTYNRFYEQVSQKIGKELFAGVGYMLDQHGRITQSGNADGSASDLTKYGLDSNTVSSGLAFQLLYDDRRNSINPDRGTYVQFRYRTSFEWLGSTNNWQSVLIDARKFIPWGNKGKNILALWSYNWFVTSGRVPYLDLPSVGWDMYYNTGRGYVQSRFRASSMFYQEAEYRFGISRNNFLGGVVFANNGFYGNWPSGKISNVNLGYGAGIRILFNKHSQTNVAIDYAFGRNGSQGIFVNLGEVF